MALALGCLFGKWPWPWGACWGRCSEGLEGFGGFGAFAGWQTAALKPHRKPLLWPWPWGACSGSGLGPGVPAGDGVWRVWRVLEGFGGFAGWQTAACCGLGPGVPVGEVALALGCLLGTVFGGFGRFCRVWRVWKVLEGLERLRAGKRQL